MRRCRPDEDECENGGRCTTNALDEINCNCTNTGYTGPTCEEGEWVFIFILQDLCKEINNEACKLYRSGVGFIN